MNLKLDTLRKKIGLGFVVMAGMLLIAIGVTSIQTGNVNTTTDRMTNVYYPSSLASASILSGVNHSIASLRGFILLGDEIFRDELDDIWETEIRASFSELELLSQVWVSDEDIQGLASLEPLLDDLFTLQQQALTIAVTDPSGAASLLESEMLELNTGIKELIEQLVFNNRVLVDQGVDEIQSQIDLLGNIQWGLAVAALFAGFFLAIQIIRSVTEPIDEAVSAANKIAEGDLDKEVDVRGAKEAEILGRSLELMRSSLKKSVEEARIYDWSTTGQNRLNNVMRGDQGIEELADNIIGFLAEYTDSNIGALYLHDEIGESYELAGKYAFNKKQGPTGYKKGEGIIGQAADDQKTVLLAEIDEKYIRIKSTIIALPPKQILAVPFVVDGTSLGVVELGKTTAFDKTETEFIESCMENVGIALFSAIARQKIQDLLEETQLQSEELQQQQEELEQNNEELEEQAQNLREQQEELQTANEELEEQSQIVEQKNRDLETARTEIELKAKQLEISSKYKSEFLANMSHELRTPLNSLLILANDLLKNKQGNLSEDEVESAEVIVKSGRDLLTLINEILDLSKIEAGKMELKISDVYIREMADDLARNFRKEAKSKAIGFTVEVDEAAPGIIRTDRQRLEQIIKNLLSNALKFTKEGEIGLQFIRNAGDFLSISVSDSGIGIPKEKQDVIFEAFQQADSGTARKYGGTGLGLSISRELARLLGGRITLESVPGKGSTFTLILPLKSDESLKADVAQPVRETEKPVRTLKESHFVNYPAIEDQRDDIDSADNVILIIEDDQDFARILARQANDKGFKYIAASTGEDGLLLAEQFKPTAIILDLILPGIDGHLVLKELKGNPDVRHIPVHIISAEEKSLDPIKSGAVQYFTKPVTDKQLNEAFSRIEDFTNRKMKKLLVVEDDESLRKSIVKLVGNGDVECVEAGTASDALQYVKDHSVDCIVLDIGLPDMSGFEFIKELEKENGHAIPPIIVYTGKELSKKENDELREYAETIIVKGIKSEERLLDETALFLHRTVKDMPAEKQDIITSFYDKETVFLGKKILLVDDDMRNVFALSKVLKEKGMTIVKAENGRVALQILEENPGTDLVLMDIMMPEMDGYECMHEIRKRKLFKDLPVIALTAKAMKNDRQKCLDAGANDYITKPVDIERLLSLMRIWIRK